MIGKYRKRPVVIEAIQWDGSEDSQREIVNWASPHAEGFFDGDGYYIAIYSMEGTMRANPGSWIIKGVSGEYYPCHSEIFEQTYEAEPCT